MSKPSVSAESPKAHAPAKVRDYEVKLLLDSKKVLGSDFKPTDKAERILDLKHPPRRIAMQFLDVPGAKPTDQRQLDAAGWNIRLRRFADSNKLELSYKRRYRVLPGQLESVLTAAAAAGFDANEDDYKVQVEWGFGRQTLSFTNDKKLKLNEDNELELPGLKEFQLLALHEMPKELDRVKEPGWARGLLAAPHLYGPVLGKRWAGEWQGPELSLEVWLVRAADGSGVDPVVELSFKEEKLKEATGLRDKLTAFLRDQDWLIEDDSLKTGLILKRY